MNLYPFIGIITLIFVVLQTANQIREFPRHLFILLHITDSLATIIAAIASVYAGIVLMDSWLNPYTILGFAILWWPLWALYLIFKKSNGTGFQKIISGFGGILALGLSIFLIFLS